MKTNRVTTSIENLIFGHRVLVIGAFLLATVFMAYSASKLRIDAGFNKLVPMEHEYMQVFSEYQDQFGGANQVLVALMVEEGDIFTPEFFKDLQEATDSVFFIPGVDRSKVYSLFTPNVRFTEIVEDGIDADNLVPADFRPDAAGLERVRQNILKSPYVGRLVANDFTGAIVSAQLLEIDPSTGEKLDYLKVSDALEQVRERYARPGLSVHIIGFAKVVGDMTDGASRVFFFFGLAFLVTAIMVYLYCRSLRRTAATLACSLFAVIWQLGMLPLLGFGIDPMGIMVPFLIFAIGVSHGVQMVSANGAEVFDGFSSFEAARRSFRRLLAPGIIALASDTIGFLTIWLIPIRVIQELAVTASLGVAAIILTNLVLLPVVLSYLAVGRRYANKLHKRARHMVPIWHVASMVTGRKVAGGLIVIACMLAVFGVYEGSRIKVGDVQQGVPEFWPDSRYNLDTKTIAEKFSIGVDVLTIFAEADAQGCIDYEVMDTIDSFDWHITNQAGVQSTMSLPKVAKVMNSAWNEGNVKWRFLPRESSVMVQAISSVPTGSGLLNADCSVMPLYVYTKDHKSETISGLVAAAKGFDGGDSPGSVAFRVGGGNLGVMAATNEEVVSAQFPILMYVFLAVIVLCLITFRSLRGTLCIVIPLALVSVLSYALMSLLGIGLKVNTLPVVALGVGVGVDYGIYIYSRFKELYENGKSIQEAYEITLDITGNAVLLTGITLAFGVGTWIFSPLKFQADMGVLLTFMFFVNMLGALILLPALARWFFPNRAKGTGPSSTSSAAGDESSPTAPVRAMG